MNRNNDPIINQHSLSDKYGNRYSRDNGCAWVAAYNIMLLSGNFMSADDIKKSLTDMNGLILRGTFGTRPKVVYKFLKKMLPAGYTVKFLRSFSVKKVGSFVENSDYVILTGFWFYRSRGRLWPVIKSIRAAAHTFAGRRTSGDGFEFFNETYHNKVSCSVSRAFQNTKSVSEYRLTFPICAISVKTGKADS